MCHVRTINLVTPPENAKLFEQIAATGALITQFPFNRPADKQSFPIRNRIVAGMTLGTVVVEANLTSSALITANFAIEYGRQVFAVPGRIDSPRSKGCHDLIKKGAKLCEGAEDILSEFEYLFPASNRPPSADQTGVLPTLELRKHKPGLGPARQSRRSLHHLSPVIRRCHSALDLSKSSLSFTSIQSDRTPDSKRYGHHEGPHSCCLASFPNKSTTTESVYEEKQKPIMQLGAGCGGRPNPVHRLCD
jgi:hypothetical protein